jgi:hypothetical protein
LPFIPFNDIVATHWAHGYVGAAAQFEWIIGHADGSFRPDRHLSRAEAVTIVNRMLGRIPDVRQIDLRVDRMRFDDVDDTHWAYYAIMEAYIPHGYHVEDDVEVWALDLE